jgi:hypothetical protein
MPWGHGCPGTATYKEVLMPWGHGCPGTAKDAKKRPEKSLEGMLLILRFIFIVL